MDGDCTTSLHAYGVRYFESEGWQMIVERWSRGSSVPPGSQQRNGGSNTEGCEPPALCCHPDGLNMSLTMLTDSSQNLAIRLIKKGGPKSSHSKNIEFITTCVSQKKYWGHVWFHTVNLKF